MCILEITSDILTVSMKMNVNFQLIDVIESLQVPGINASWNYEIG